MSALASKVEIQVQSKVRSSAVPQHERGSNWIHPSLGVVETPECGVGVVALTDISKGTLVVMFGGIVITQTEFDELSDELQHFPFQVTDDLFLAPRGLDDLGIGERINHSCEPNVGFSGAIALSALRDITKGESITFDYATCVASDDDAFHMECRCGSRICRGVITGQDWRLREVQDRLLPYFQPFLQEKVRAARAPLGSGSSIGTRRVANDDSPMRSGHSGLSPMSVALRVGQFLRESLAQEWMAIPICILAGIPSTLLTTVIMAMIAPSLRYFEFATSDAGFISAVSLLSSVVGYGTYLLAYYAGMLWKERSDWFVGGRVERAGLRRKVKIIQYDFLAHLPSDIWVMPLMGAATGGFFVAGASQFWSILLAHTIADVVYAIKEPFFWHGAKELVAWQEGRSGVSTSPSRVGS